MYYVPDNTEKCGYYECTKVRNKIPEPFRG